MPDVDAMTHMTSMLSPSSRSSTDNQAKALGDESPAKLEQACRDFESLFIHQMLKQMRRTVPQDGMFSGGNGEKLYTSMLDGELSKSIAQQRGIGLAPALIRQLAELQNHEKK